MKYFEVPAGSSSSSLQNISANSNIKYPQAISNEEKIFGPSLKNSVRFEDGTTDRSSFIPLRLILQATVLSLVGILDFVLVIYAIINFRDLLKKSGSVTDKIARIALLVGDIIFLGLSFKLLAWFTEKLRRGPAAEGDYQRVLKHEPTQDKELSNWSDLAS